MFVTAHDHYAVAAFEHSACDYLLKPASLERLARTVARLKAALRDKPAGEADALRALLRQAGRGAARRRRRRRCNGSAPRTAAKPG